MQGWFQKQERAPLPWSSAPPCSGNLGAAHGPSGPVPPTPWAPLGPRPHLTCGKTAVRVEAEDGISADGCVRQEAVAGLWWEGGEANSAMGTLPRLPQGLSK